MDPGLADWVRQAVGPEVAGRPAERLDGSTTATVLRLGDLVLRWYDDPWFLADEPDAIVREAGALRTLADGPVPAPRLIAVSEADPPAVLMTHVPGERAFLPPDPAALRDLLAQIHATPPGALAPWRYAGYHEGRVARPPAWWRDAATWERAVARSASGRPAAPDVVIHRDFHPGNVLWAGSRVAGIVDWVNACLGPAAFDTAHFRVNLATIHGPEVADELLPGDSAWDLEAALGFLDSGDDVALDAWAGPWPHVSAADARVRLEAFVARALALLA